MNEKHKTNQLNPINQTINYSDIRNEYSTSLEFLLAEFEISALKHNLIVLNDSNNETFCLYITKTNNLNWSFGKLENLFSKLFFNKLTVSFFASQDNNYNNYLQNLINQKNNDSKNILLNDALENTLDDYSLFENILDNTSLNKNISDDDFLSDEFLDSIALSKNYPKKINLGVFCQINYLSLTQYSQITKHYLWDDITGIGHYKEL